MPSEGTRERLAAILKTFAAQAYAYEEGIGPIDVGSQIPEELERAIDAILEAVPAAVNGPGLGTEERMDDLIQAVAAAVKREMALSAEARELERKRWEAEKARVDAREALDKAIRARIEAQAAGTEQERCPTCGSDTPLNPTREECSDPWHDPPTEQEERWTS